MSLRITKLFCRILALLLILLAIIGVILPVVPTVPFLIAALWASSKGWPTLEHYLLNHSKYSDEIRAWRDSGAIKYRTNVIAIAMMIMSYATLFIVVVDITLRVIIGIILIIVGLWLVTRPKPTKDNKKTL